jgi:hypothetical protein
MHLRSNCARFTQQPGGGLWISIGPKYRRIEAVAYSVVSTDAATATVYIRLERNSLRVVAGQSRRNVLLGGFELGAHLHGSRQILQCGDRGKGRELRGARIGSRGKVLNLHREPAEFTLDANLMDVFSSTWHGEDSDP